MVETTTLPATQTEIDHWSDLLAKRQEDLAKAIHPDALRKHAGRVAAAAKHLAAALEKRTAITASLWSCRSCGREKGPNFDPHYWNWGVCAGCLFERWDWAHETADAWRTAHTDAMIEAGVFPWRREQQAA